MLLSFSRSHPQAWGAPEVDHFGVKRIVITGVLNKFCWFPSLYSITHGLTMCHSTESVRPLFLRVRLSSMLTLLSGAWLWLISKNPIYRWETQIFQYRFVVVLLSSFLLSTRCATQDNV